MIKEGKIFASWHKNIHVKVPATIEGIKAVQQLKKLKIKTNVTLVFSESQAAAVYQASLGAKRGQVFISPFVGRLDDMGKRGMDLIKNIIKMYKNGDGHVEVLTASIRNREHLLEAINFGSDCLTAPLKVLGLAKQELINQQSINNLETSKVNLQPIPYENVSLDRPWQEYDLKHSLTDQGIKKFTEDWNGVLI
jgi:transaldolase